MNDPAREGRPGRTRDVRALRGSLASAVLLVLLAAPACERGPPDEVVTTSSTPPPAKPAVRPYAPCAGHPLSTACADSIESDLLGRIDTAHRSADTLLIRGENGAVLPLVSGFPPDFPMHFRYAGFLPEIGQHGVEVAFFEGGEYLLVDATSTQQTHTIGPPHLSPSGDRFVTVSLDLVAGYDPNGIQVWVHAPGGPRIEWDVRGGWSWGASDPAWVNDSTVTFLLHRADPSDPTLTTGRPFRLTLRQHGVAVDPILP